MSHLRTCYACVTQGGCRRHTGGCTFSLPAAVDPGLWDVNAWVHFEERAVAMSRTKSAAESPLMLWTDETFSAEHPCLYEFLRETAWDDGKHRKTGTLLITVDAGAIKCAVHDRDGRRSAWVTADTWEALLCRVEDGLSSVGLEWRRDTR